MRAGQVWSGSGAARHGILARRIRLLVAATITYNVVEAFVAIGAGTVASSTALIGFGLDSVIEVSSAAAVAWQFAGRDPQARERAALRLIAVAFFALAAFVTVSAVLSLSGAGEPEHSPVGIILAAVSLAVMPFLSLAQRRAGRELGSRSAVADSRQTLLCTYLSGVLLLGLVLNSALGWSWADPVAALVIAAVAVKEGRDAWKGDSCCLPAPLTSTSGDRHAMPHFAPDLASEPSVAQPVELTPGTTADAPTRACCPGNEIRTPAAELRNKH
ncbi:cation transporter [Paeniglutamicibacter sulfureus]|uniref:cation transporter n=1 Tax=Paeniglutamicibacter sulfureus TaxID=43666 RepID=UPI0026653E23|nr:cation transporter [Paeniglutamicibacter sulfureus]MDO2935183.1 cation transporter [Paeniglutamicibacter sulfureus]